MFGSQPAYPEKLLHKKESLQNQLINIRVELSQATTVGNHGNQSGSTPARRASPPRRCSPNPSSPQRARAGCSWGGTQTQTGALPCKETAGKPGCSPTVSMELANFPPTVPAPGRREIKATCFPGCSVFSPGEPGPWQQCCCLVILVGPRQTLPADGWVIARRAAANAPESMAQRGEQTSRGTPLPSVSFPFTLRFPWPDLGEQEGEGAMFPAPACPHVWRGCYFLLLRVSAGWAVAPLIRLALGCH